MIQKLEISAQHTELTPRLKRYIEKKIGTLDRFVTRHARQTVHADVKLSESKSKDKQQFTCNVVLTVPDGVIDASETTVNMYAAVDIVEAKLKTQLKKYKEKKVGGKLYRRLFARSKER